MNGNEPLKRRIRSFMRRGGRMTKSQRYGLSTLWKTFGLDTGNDLLNLDAIFDRSAPRILEIGFGMGQSLLEQACQNPEKDYIGIEVHRPGIGNLLAMMAMQPISNIRVLYADATEILEHCLPDNSLDAIQIFFPDPWPKRRHHKRRLIQPSFVELLKQKLKMGGYLYLATDWQDYANHMLKVISKVDGFENTAGTNQFSKRPTMRPLTKFEQRGQRLGHTVLDLAFIKKPSS